MSRDPITEADILAQVIAPDQSDLSPEAAKALLRLKFNRQATAQIRRLLAKNNKGIINAAERIALEKYLRVGQLLDLLRAKAQLSLRLTVSGQ
jgi:hypothetical protein